MNRWRTGVVVMSLALVCGTMRGFAADSTHVVLTIDTGMDTAFVFIDTIRAGFTPLTVTSTPGKHILRLVHADASSWLAGTISDTLVLAPGDERTLRYEFEQSFMIVTTPSGASIRVGDSLVGTTPLMMRLPADGPLPQLLATKAGYDSVMVVVPRGHGGIARAVLTGLWQVESPETSLLSESSGGGSLKYYLAGGATFLSGAAAAYFKIKADRQNALFLQTGDPARQADTRKYDTAAAISLVLTEIGFACLTYFLLSD